MTQSGLGFHDVTAGLEVALDSMSVVTADGAGSDVGASVIAPSASTRVRAVTVLTNNSEYLAWMLDSIGRNMIATAKLLGPFNPLKIGIMAMAKFIRHPNAWKFLVHQVAECSDQSFDRYWPDVSKLVREIDGE